MSRAAVAARWPLVGRRPELAAFCDALEDPECYAFVVHGPAGVGKTRLGEECLQLAERSGYACGRAAASAEAGAMPLAAIAHLLPGDLHPGEGAVSGRVASVQLFARGKRAFEDRGGDARFMLMVDDLQNLDVTTATLLRQLLVARVVFLVGTVLSDRRAPTSVTALWRDERCRRVDLDELPRDSVETLLHQALGAPVDGPAAHTLWSTSKGNVLFLRELVLGAERSGALVDEDGVWRLARPLTSTPRLNDLVAARVARVDESGRRTLELLALCAPLGPDALDDAVDPDTLEALEEAGLVTVTMDGRRRSLALAHPVHREVIRSETPRLRRTAMLLHQAGVLERRGARRREDPLRVATWRLEATGEADRELLLQAAWLAHYTHDYPLVVRLAGAAQAQRPGPEAGLLLGKALFELGSFFEADVELARAGRLAQGSEHQVAVAAAQAANLVWGLLRPDDALALNRAARRAAAGDARDELIALEAWILVFTGQPAQARALTGPPPRRASRGAVVRALASSYALTLEGSTDAGLSLAQRAHVAHLELGDQLWLDQPASHVLARVLALTEAGRLGEAAECARTGYLEASEEQVPLLQIRFAFHRGRIALLSGRARTARRWYREAVACSGATRFDGPRAFALSGLAVAEALLGNVDAAKSAVVAMDEVQDFRFLLPERELGRAWCLVGSGDLPGACRVLSDAADEAIDSGHLTSASWLLHDIARLGRADVAAGRLDHLAGTCQSELVSARAGHARAIVDADVDALELSADRLEGMGALLVAAEAAAAASQAASRDGFPRRARALGARSVALAARCERAWTPALIDAPVAVALTRRERDVAAMAAAGMPSREIATRLYLSVRTVNNHLQRVYAKLGVASRHELLASLVREDRDGEP